MTKPMMAFRNSLMNEFMEMNTAARMKRTGVTGYPHVL